MEQCYVINNDDKAEYKTSLRLSARAQPFRGPSEVGGGRCQCSLKGLAASVPKLMCHSRGA